jgi:hypothetical protein
LYSIKNNNLKYKMGFKDLIGKAVFADYVSEEEPKQLHQNK